MNALIRAATICGFAAVLAVGAANAALADDLLYALKIGVLAHDVPDLWSGFQVELDAADINIEAQFAAAWALPWGAIRPVVGGTINTRGDTSHAYIDARWQGDLPSGIFFGVGLGAALSTERTSGSQVVDKAVDHSGARMTGRAPGAPAGDRGLGHDGAPDRTSAAGTTWRGLLRGPADLVVTLAPDLAPVEAMVTVDSLLAAVPRAVVRLGEQHLLLAGPDPRLLRIEDPLPATARVHLDVGAGMYGGAAWVELIDGLDGEVGRREVAGGGAVLEDLRLLRRAAHWDRPELAPTGAPIETTLRRWTEDVTLASWLGGWHGG